MIISMKFEVIRIMLNKVYYGVFWGNTVLVIKKTDLLKGYFKDI